MKKSIIKIQQAILVGVLFAFILGGLSYLAKDNLANSTSRNLVVIIESNSQIDNVITKLKSKNNSFSSLVEELYYSIQYSKAKYINDDRFSEY